MFSISSLTIWFLIGLFFLLGELIAPTFVLLFFGIGAWISALCLFIGLAPYFTIQVAIFSLSSILTLWLFRAKGKELARGKVSTHKSEESSITGSIGYVIEDIDPQALLGKVELHGTNWKALSDVAIKKGTAVKIISNDNLTLRVKPINK